MSWECVRLAKKILVGFGAFGAAAAADEADAETCDAAAAADEAAADVANGVEAAAAERGPLLANAS